MKSGFEAGERVSHLETVVPAPSCRSCVMCCVIGAGGVGRGDDRERCQQRRLAAARVPHFEPYSCGRASAAARPLHLALHNPPDMTD